MLLRLFDGGEDGAPPGGGEEGCASEVAGTMDEAAAPDGSSEVRSELPSEYLSVLNAVARRYGIGEGDWKALEKALQEYQGDYVYVAHHSGFYEDVFTTQPDREILYVFGGYEYEYNPAIMYNRAILEDENQIIQGVRDMSPEPYKQALALASNMAAMAEVNIESDNGQVTVSGRVARDLVGKPIYLSCYLIEDGISTKDYPQLGMDDADAPSDLKDVFRHNGVILHYFTTEAIGDLLSTEANGSYSVTYPMVDKSGFGGTARRLVAFVHKVNKSDPYDTYVLNAAEKNLDDDDRIISVDYGQRNESDIMYDLSGRMVSNPQKGLYIKGNKKILLHHN